MLLSTSKSAKRLSKCGFTRGSFVTPSSKMLLGLKNLTGVGMNLLVVQLTGVPAAA
jgi:hypothetical protein